MAIFLSIGPQPFCCKRCGGPLKVVAYITDSGAIRRILDHLGFSPQKKPPPDVREVVRAGGRRGATDRGQPSLTFDPYP